MTLIHSTIIDYITTCYNYNFSKLNFCQFAKMEKLMKAAENFEKTAVVEEVFDENLFVEFMNKVPIWDYFANDKSHYLSLSESKIRDKISKYYSDMKCQKTGGKYILFFLNFFLF